MFPYLEEATVTVLLQAHILVWWILVHLNMLSLIFKWPFIHQEAGKRTGILVNGMNEVIGMESDKTRHGLVHI